MKIIIGTANFEKNYGFTNYSINHINKIKQILFYCSKNKINYLDTAYSYIDNNKIKKLLDKSKLKIISKFSLKDFNLKKDSNFLEKEFSDLQINTLLFHDTKDLLDLKHGSILLKKLSYLKKKKFIKKIGISIYEPNELKKVLKIWKPDIIQLPLNPLNTKFLDLNILKQLKKKKIEIHIRSIFLQGVLLKNINDLPEKLKKKKLIIKWNKWCDINKVDKLQYIINFIDRKEIDKVVVGIDNLENLKSIVKAFKKNKINKNKLTKNLNFKINKKDGIEDPRKW